MALPPIAHPPKGADATREKLLQAAHELLAEHPGAEPTVSQVCERAGVQVAMVSYCFGGKAQMLDALVERIGGGIAAQLEQLAALELPAEETLRRHLGAVIRNFFEFPYVSQYHGPPLSRMFAGPMTDFYRRLLADDVFRDVDPELFFFSVVGMCEYLFAARSMLDAELDEALVQRFTEHTIDLVLRGVAALPAQP